MAFLQQVTCPMNMAEGGKGAQVCFSNYDELYGVPRGTTFGVNADSLNRWKYVGEEWRGEQFLEPPYDDGGHTNYQLVLEWLAQNNTNPDAATPQQRALGTMRCAVGTTPVWRGKGNVKTRSGALVPVSIWQCEVATGPRTKVRSRALHYGKPQR